jgi:hypothetical protein
MIEQQNYLESHTKSIHLTLKHDILRTINWTTYKYRFYRPLYYIKHARINTTLL